MQHSSTLRTNTESMAESGFISQSQIQLQAAGLKDFVSFQKKKHFLLSDIISQSAKCSLTPNNAAVTKQEYLSNNEWFLNKQQEMCDHRKMINGVFEALDRKLFLSSSSWTILYQFFQDRIKHERAMCTDAITNKQLTLIYKDTDNLHHQIYPSFQRAFTEFDQMHVKQAQQVMEFCQFIEIGIMKDILLKSKELLQKGLKGVRQQIINDKEKIQKMYVKMNEKFEKYLSIYETIYTGKRSPTPLFNEQIEFLAIAKQQLQFQNEFGLHVLQYWNESFEKESNKLQAISEALRLYITKYEEIFGKTKMTEYPVQLVNELKPIDDCKQFFSIEETLNADCMNVIYKYADSQAIDMEELKKYMTEYSFSGELERPNFLQMFQIQRNRGTLSKSYKPCYAVITSDQFLLLADEQIEPNANKFSNKAKNFYRLEFIQFKVKNNTNEVEVQEKAPGFFSSSKSKWLMLESQEKLEEIKQYIGSILN